MNARAVKGCKYLALGLPLLIVAGCGQQGGGEAVSNAAGSNGTGSQVAEGAKEPGSAPEGSTAEDAATKRGQPESAEEAMQVGAQSTRLAFRSQPDEIAAGKPTTWTLKITDAKTGAPVKSFETEMTQKMHLIVVRKDLSWFNHIHPKLGEDGTFTVSTTLPSAGTYKLYADYTPTGRQQEVPQHEFSTAGAAANVATPSLTPSKMRGPWMLQDVTAHADGEPSKGNGARYQVALMPMPASLKAGQDSMLHFQVRDASGKPLSDLQPYLGAMGHCVILSQDSNKYLHSHPMSAGDESMAGMDHSKMGHGSHAAAPTSGGPDVMFHTNFPQAGLYKAWGQFKHKGQILTAAFVLNVGEAGAKEAAGTAQGSGEHAEHAGHAH